MIIGIIGGSSINKEIYNISYEVGKLIAENNWILICGGMGGVMEAASKGAFDNNGTTIGILPTSEKTDANPYIKIPIPTNMGYARNYIIVQTADVLVAIDGKTGTLNEITAALNMGKTVISLYSWDLNKIGISENNYIKVNSPKEVIDIIKKL